MIAYNETLITTNFQIESIIGLRDMGESKFVEASVHTFWNTNFYVYSI